MFKKISATLLVVILLAVSIVSPRIIDSFDNLLEKFNFIVPADVNIKAGSLRQTYRSSALGDNLGFKTVALSENEAAKLGLNTAVEKDFIVRAETVDSEQNEAIYEGYTWNIPFVKGSEDDINTFGNSDIKVGILDSGVSLNDEFEDIVRIDLVPDTIYDSLGIYNDVTGHGTGVAGVIAAEKNDDGVIGIAPDVSVYSIRVLDENNEAPISRIIAGIEWAIENDINVLNMSFGTENYSAQLYNAIRRAYENGMVLVSSAGNTGGISEQVTYPARFPEVISVGSCNQNGEESEFSPNSTDVDILAPGEYINSIGLVNGFCVENGTSLAAPHVTAAAALILSADNTKNPEFVKQLLVSTANVSENSRGILDIKNALDTLPNFEDVATINPTQIPENTEEIENFEISEDVVVGSWSKIEHEKLIWVFDEETPYEENETIGELGVECQTTDVNNIKLFAKAAYMADYLYGFNCKDSDDNQMKRFSPLHAVGYTSGATSDSRKTTKGGSMNSNYVADTKYLYRLAVHFAKSDSIAEAKATMNDEKKVPTQNSNYQILRKIVASESVIYVKKTVYQKEDVIEWMDVQGIVYADILLGVSENSPEKAAWKILGLAAHLAGDAFAHRVRVPISSTTSEKGVFYLDDAPPCFRGDGHKMTSGDNQGPRNDDVELLKTLLKEQDTYHSSYVNSTTIKLCQCYDCLKAAVAAGKVEFRDISDKYVDSDLDINNEYDGDSTGFYAKRFEIGTKNAVSKLISRFNSKSSFSILTFLPDATEYPDYTLKLNGFIIYLEDVGFPFDELTEDDDDLLDRIQQLSTSTII